MAIQIKSVDVIDDSLNVINMLGVRAGAAGTQSWSTGSTKVIISDGLFYGPGSPVATSPGAGAGDIKFDGLLLINSFNKVIFPLA